jgi:hypothetical protein
MGAPDSAYGPFVYGCFLFVGCVAIHLTLDVYKALGAI